MKTLNIWLEDKEYELLKKAKGELNWHDFILKLAQASKTNEKGKKRGN